MIEAIAAGLVSSAIGEGASKSFSAVQSQFSEGDSPSGVFLREFTNLMKKNENVPVKDGDWDSIQTESKKGDWIFADLQSAIEQVTNTIYENSEEDIPKHAIRSAVTSSFYDALNSFIEEAKGSDLADSLGIRSDVKVLQELNEAKDELEQIKQSAYREEYYNIFSSENIEGVKEYFYAQGGVEKEPRFVDRPEISDVAEPQKLLLIGRKGSGKTRTLAELADRFCRNGDIKDIIIPTDALTNSEDLRPLLSEDFSGDILLIWDDIHDLSPLSDNEIFREAILKLEEEYSGEDGSLYVLAATRAEERHQLPNYENKEDKLWSKFHELELEPLQRSVVTMLLQSGLSAYDLAASHEVRERFIENVINTDPSPFYIFSIMATADEGGELALELVEDLPNDALQIWKNQYTRTIRRNKNTRFVLWALHLLAISRVPLYGKLVRGIFSEVFGRDKYEFRPAARNLIDSHWMSSSTDEVLTEKTYYRIHDIQVEAVDENLSSCLNDFSNYVLEIPETHLAKDSQLAAQLNHNLAVVISNRHPQKHQKIVEEHYKKAISLRPNYVSAKVNYGTLLLQQNCLENAERHIREALKLDSNNANAHAIFGNLLAQQNRITAAKSHYEDSLKLNPYQPGTHHNYANLLIGLQEYEKAENHLRKSVQLDPADAKTRNSLGNLLRTTNRLEEAEKQYEAAIDISPKYGNAQINRGILYMSQGRAEEAEEAFRRGIRNTSDRKGEALHNLATLLLKNNRLKEAETHAKKAIEINPKFPNAYNTLAGIQREKGNLEAAKQSYWNALELNPRYTTARKNLKEIYLNTDFSQLESDVKSFDDTEDVYQMAVKTEVLLGLYQSMGEWNKAIQKCEKVLTFDNWEALNSKLPLSEDFQDIFRSYYLNALARNPQ